MPHPPVLALGALDVLLVLVLGAVGFAVVIGVTVVVMVILQAILPRTDSEAEAVHRAEQERALEEAPEGGADEPPGAGDEQPAHRSSA